MSPSASLSGLLLKSPSIPSHPVLFPSMLEFLCHAASKVVKIKLFCKVLKSRFRNNNAVNHNIVLQYDSKKVCFIFAGKSPTMETWHKVFEFTDGVVGIVKLFPWCNYT